MVSACICLLQLVPSVYARLFGEISALATALAREAPGSAQVCNLWNTGEVFLGVQCGPSRPESLLVFRASELPPGCSHELLQKLFSWRCQTSARNSRMEPVPSPLSFRSCLTTFPPFGPCPLHVTGWSFCMWTIEQPRVRFGW